MPKWTAEIMSDPERNHALIFELEEDDNFRAMLYRDDAGKLQLRIYEGPNSMMPVEWLLCIIQRFSEECPNA